MKKIGIIGAMDIEIEALKSKMTIDRTVSTASMEFLDGSIEGTDVVLVKCGIGKVNAAICAQTLCNLFHVTHMINTGIAGSLNADINIGDVVVSTDAMYHDVDGTVFGYQPGEVPGLGCREFIADSRLAEIAVQSCKTVNPEIQVWQGRIVSGDQFISDKAVKKHLVEEFSPFCTEMEGAAIAHTAWLNHVPFVIIRAISDKADDSAEMDYPSFEQKAAANSARMTEYMLPLIEEA